MKKILILGPQGSGKGTQANRLSEKLSIPAFSMGQLLRDEIASKSELGKEIDAIIHGRGELVPDDVALSVLEKRLKQDDAKEGYILDGYPRNMAQYTAFEAYDQPTAVLVITVDREESVKRLTKRAGVEGRPDDSPALIEKRLEIYQKETTPVVQEYEKVGLIQFIDGMGEVEDVERRIDAALHI